MMWQDINRARPNSYSGVQKLRNTKRSLGTLFIVRKVEQIQSCKSQYNFLNNLTYLIQNLRPFGPLTKKWNDNEAK